MKWTEDLGGKKGLQRAGTTPSSRQGDAVGVPQGFTRTEQPFFRVPLPTAQPPAPHPLPPALAGRELLPLSLRKTWMGIKHTAVTLPLSTGEGRRLQAEDAARLLSVERVAHLPASACHVVGKGSPLPPILRLIPTVFCSVPEVSLTPSPSPLSPAPGRIFMR